MSTRSPLSRRIASSIGAAVAATVALTTVTAAAPAEAAGNRSILSRISGSGFDTNSRDFDIARTMIKRVLKTKPNSPLRLLGRGSTRATAFLPSDGVMRAEAAAFGSPARRESSVYNFFLTAGSPDINDLETFMLGHVIFGKTLDRRDIGLRVGRTTRVANGKTYRVTRVSGAIRLVDSDRFSADPTIRRWNLNSGNRQVIHVVDRVMPFPR